jgi:hypothetical protein
MRSNRIARQTIFKNEELHVQETLRKLQGTTSLEITSCICMFWSALIQGAVAELPWLSRLSLDRCNIGDEMLESIDRLENLEVLCLSKPEVRFVGENDLSDNAAPTIGRLTNLKELNLEGIANSSDSNRFTDVGAKLFCRLTQLEVLNLSTD